MDAGQGTRLYGSLHEHLYTYSPKGLYVDIYAPSTITFVYQGVPVSVTTATDFPYGNGSVGISVDLSSPLSFDLTLRIPSWISTPTISVNVGGTILQGIQGSYLHISQQWSAGQTTVSLTFPRELQAVEYTGYTTIPGYTRYAYTYGPILLAAQGGGWNTTLTCININGVNPNTPSTWLAPSTDGNALHFDVTQGPSAGVVTFIPHFEVQFQQFAVYPAFPAAAA
jgi:DUF1680 family protein